jgi:hypothetical protein
VEEMDLILKDIEVIMCCLPRDLPIARLAVDGVRRYVSSGKISLATNPTAFAECRRVLGNDVELLDEREISGGMTLEQLQELHIDGFPSRAGWYLQQMVKLGYALIGSPSEYYLIWDCDTVPLRRLNLFEADSRPLYTMADERHSPYFDTYERLFGYKPDYIGSFISQHMVVNKAIAREMFAELEARYPKERSWSWAIMNNLASVKSLSLFSEYETYGYYAATRYPEKVIFRRLPWIRDGALHTINPTERQLKKLSRQYYFAAFESWQFKEAQLRTKTSSIRHRMYGVAKRLLGTTGF